MLAADDGQTLRMRDPGVVPDSAEVARRLTAEALVAELFSRFDARDVDAALALYTEDATVFQAHGRDAVRSVMERGMSPLRGRHLITNLRAWSLDADRTAVEYTAAAFTLEGDGPFTARSVFDHRQLQRREPDGVWRIAEHEIHGYTPPA
ncbi:nuclear transport factor 2 family protein [Parafrankia sp. BMG5.11]|uniref:nuclear transport factor 2 family protein n=2 Tax=unclassified Parafrankia TaxID=2994368 RepID=UPI000DA55EEF|nr:nuclear transport factor 2 family protein [Parafrankia sp. BMG5.11]TCJ36617.1 DUF4440 domain-containing protein [Parafrankia sp. BMG5.11]SQD98994.1 conserved hypothetical protein [Parafrankia sp. Ea1.12]